MDSTFQTQVEVRNHKLQQAIKITANMTDDHHPELIKDVWGFRQALEQMPLQLYLQSCAMVELLYNTLFDADIYFAFRRPEELGAYHWVIDGKEKDKTTNWEDWWSEVVLPMIESKTLRKPMAKVEGADYSWHDRFVTEPDEYKKQFMDDPDKGDFFDLKLVLKEDFRFSSDPEYGLEAVDILTNAVRRSMSGNFRRFGWLPVRSLMIHSKDHYIRLITLAERKAIPQDVPYMGMLNDFRSGGRIMLPPGT
jgi:hypothetical protein